MKNYFCILLLVSALSFPQRGMNMGMGGGGMGRHPQGSLPSGSQFNHKNPEVKMSVEEQLKFLKENLKTDELQELLLREELLKEDKMEPTTSHGNTLVNNPNDMESFRKKREESFKKILSPEQFQKWKELTHKSPKKEGDFERNTMAKLYENMEELALTEEQKKAIHDFSNPQDMSQQEPFDPQKKEKEFENFLKSTLTKEQYKKWKSILKK